MKLKTWLKAERGRSKSLAEHLRVTEGRITQVAASGLPPAYMQSVSDFTQGVVSVADLVADHAAKEAKEA